MILKVVKYGDPVLSREGSTITEFNGQLAELVENMFETMHDERGVGLAAPQVAQSIKLFVMDCSGGKDPSRRFAFINPQIVETKDIQVGEEGCLSFPGIYFEVERPRIVTISALDIHGKEFTTQFEDLEARCVIHETDHVYGKVFIEYLSPLKRDLVKRKIKKRIKLGDWE
ncbi:MAG: peptide deformylase [Acidobacteriota bacterium]|nr:MAG: peptide deformylase [Acidobacteriota bacterium]